MTYGKDLFLCLSVECLDGRLTDFGSQNITITSQISRLRGEKSRDVKKMRAEIDLLEHSALMAKNAVSFS
jgi:hypothetical protein